VQLNHSKNCLDATFTFRSEQCYEMVVAENCFDCKYCQDCSQCSSCIFGFDLRNCSDCLFSSNLRNKQYYIWNKPYSKEEYFKHKAAYDFSSWEKREEYRKQFEEFIIEQAFHRHANLRNCESCTGHNIYGSQNVLDSFCVMNAKDSRYLTSIDGAKDCYDVHCTGRSELCYEGLTPDDAYFARFTINCWSSKFIDYSDN